jgi:hypothetical protein
VITSLSNRVGFALLDLLLIGAIAAILAPTVVDLARLGHLGLWRTGGRIVSRIALVVAIAYLLFLAVWGLNYRRVPLGDKLQFDAAAVTPVAARTLASSAALHLNTLHDGAHARGWPPDGVIDQMLVEAFAAAQRTLDARRLAVAGRPKHSLLDLYFRRASVDGMTDPYFLETLVVSDLLPFERPFTVAHEWAHLAGFADEGDANFVAWLTCANGAPPLRYSGWLFLYTEIAAGLRRADRDEVAGHLAPGPRADLGAMASRVARNVSPRISAAGWGVYDQFLKGNRIKEGTASYGEVVKLALGTPLGRLTTGSF